MSEKNIHSGHRQRVKDRFLRDGIDGFAKHEMLELLLFYSVPLKDTNPIAHKLLNKFGSLKAVFEATVEELCTVEGVSTHTATLIKLIPSIWREANSEINDKEQYNSVSKLGELMIKKYAGINVETVFLVMLDNSMHIIDIAKICEGSVNQVHADMRKMLELTIRKNAAFVLVTHNHPNGSIIPSSEDLTTTKELEKAFNTIRVDMLEHLLIAGDKYDVLLAKTENAFWQKPNRKEFYK